MNIEAIEGALKGGCAVVGASRARRESATENARDVTPRRMSTAASIKDEPEAGERDFRLRSCHSTPFLPPYRPRLVRDATKKSPFRAFDAVLNR